VYVEHRASRLTCTARGDIRLTCIQDRVTSKPHSLRHGSRRYIRVNNPRSGSYRSRSTPTQLQQHPQTQQSCPRPERPSARFRRMRAPHQKTSSSPSHSPSSMIFVLLLRLRALDPRRSKAYSRIANMALPLSGYATRRHLGLKISIGR